MPKKQFTKQHNITKHTMRAEETREKKEFLSNVARYRKLLKERDSGQPNENKSIAEFLLDSDNEDELNFDEKMSDSSDSMEESKNDIQIHHINQKNVKTSTDKTETQIEYQPSTSNQKDLHLNDDSETLDDNLDLLVELEQPKIKRRKSESSENGSDSEIEYETTPSNQQDEIQQISSIKTENGNLLIKLEVDENISENSDELELDRILELFDLKEVKPYLYNAAITYRSLPYLSKEDIKEAIPPIGLRALFREKLFAWRKSELGISDDKLPEEIANKVISWLQNPANSGSASVSVTPLCAPSRGCKLSKKLEDILQHWVKGKAIKNFYEKNGHLIDSLRSDLINIILEDIFDQEVTLSPKDFPLIIDEIIENFPNEMKEYYFIPRCKKKNPSGKLWDKYYNQRSKRAKITLGEKDKTKDICSTSKAALNTEIDESFLVPLKNSLSREFSNWEEVKDKWQRTFLLRQREIKTSSTYSEFLKNWPLYSNPRSHELINIDFELLYPNKRHLLFTKWDSFSKSIKKYYSCNIKDKKSREIFSDIENITDQNSLDYLLTILLNSVILPTARFRNKNTKLHRKLSIPEANDSFVVHLTTINNYEKV